MSAHGRRARVGRALGSLPLVGRALGSLAVLLVLVIAPAALGQPPTAGQSPGASAERAGEPPRGTGYAPIEPRASLPDIEDEVMCPICGVPLEHAIEAPQAQQEREFIRGLIAQGLSKDEIKDRLVAEFGPEVLALPEAEGFDLAAWLVPGAAIIAAAAAIFVGLRRWRAARAAEEPAESKRPPLSAEDAKRLDEDLARYEL